MVDNPFMELAPKNEGNPFMALAPKKPPNPFLEPVGDVGRAPPAAGAAGVAPPAPAAPTKPPEPEKAGYKFSLSGFVPRTFGKGGLADVYKEEVGANLDAMKGGVEDIKKGDYLKGAAKTGLGAVGYISSPISAAAKTYVGDPLRRGTGSPTLGNVGEFLATAAIPGPHVKAGVLATPVGRDTLKTAEKIFSPEVVGPLGEQAGASIRKEMGQAARNTETTRAALAEHTLQLDAAPQHWEDVINQMEGRAHNTPVSFSPLVQTLKTAYDERKRALQALPSTAQMNFITDYFPHAWEAQPGMAPRATGAPKQGATGFVKERSIPTVADGVAQGLVPKNLNPIDATMAYIKNADRFIATNTVFDEARNMGTAKFFQPGKAPDGWVPLAGRLSQRGSMVAHAPEDYALVYNNFISKGIQGPWRDVYDKAQHASNAITALELGLSAYHARTMMKEAVTNQVAKAFQAAARGDVKSAAESALGAAFAPITLPYKGNKLEKVYLGTTPGSRDMQEIANLLTEAGGRAKGGVKYTGGEYEFGKHGSFVTRNFIDAFKKGELRTAALANARDIKKSLAADVAGMKAAPVAGTAAAFAKNFGRVMDTVAQPLFDIYIPKLKNGAFYENMGDWIKANPGASHDEKVAAARAVWDSVDNRFGEMVKDNIFWNQTMKQAAMLSMRSYSWNMGTIREVGGGLKDLTLDHNLSQRAAYLMGLVTTDAIGNAAYQYLKTGEGPKDMQDLIAPRTGGTTASGAPERAGIVGYMKDVYGWYEDPLQEAKNKIATGPRLVGETLSGQDWKGQPIAPTPDKDAGWQQNVPPWLAAHFKHVVDALGPISVKDIMKGREPGSNIPGWERALGTRPAGLGLTEPDRLEAIKEKKSLTEHRKKERADAREKARYGGPQ